MQANLRQKLETGRWVSVQTFVFMLLLIGVFYYLFTLRQHWLQSLSGLHKTSFDMWFGYSPEDVYAVLHGLGPEGRRIYMLSEWSIDLIFPIVYNLALWLMLTLFFGKILSANNPLRRITAVPLVVLIADYMENISITGLILSFPNKLILLARTASLITSVKIILGVSCLVVGLIGLVIYLFQRKKVPLERGL